MSLEMALWPEEIIEINRELASGLHPELEKKLENLQGDGNWIERFATIAAYCEVALDGMYTSDQIVGICRVLIPRLKELRKRHDDGKPEIIRDLNPFPLGTDFSNGPLPK